MTAPENPKSHPASDESIDAPNVYLFASFLKKNREHADKIKGNHPLWQWCDRFLKSFDDKQLTPQLQFPEDPTDEIRIDLLPNDTNSLDFRDRNNPDLEGAIQPLQLHDSYVIYLNVGYPDNEESASSRFQVPISSLGSFNPNKELLIAPDTPLFLGSTLLVTAWLTTRNKQLNFDYLHNLSDACYTELIGQTPPPVPRRGELFGSTIYEYELPKNGDRCDRVLVWLFRDENADQKFSDCYQQFTELFFYRHKVVRAFQDSRKVYQNLDRDYTEVEPKLDSLHGKLETAQKRIDYRQLEQFQSQLKVLATDALSYTRSLRKLEDYQTTIEINLYNYNEKLAQICGKLEVDKEELSTLSQFSEATAPHFLRKISADLRYYKHGTDLIEGAIASIRGIVEIDQAKRDRAIENTIQNLGAGLGAGGIAASALSGHISTGMTLKLTGNWQDIHPGVLTLLVSGGIGIFFFAIAACLNGSIAKWWQKYR
jgi:hypothetical protein